VSDPIDGGLPDAAVGEALALPDAAVGEALAFPDAAVGEALAFPDAAVGEALALPDATGDPGAAPDSDPAAFASLGVPNFRWYFVGQTLSSVGNWFQMLAMALLIVELTGSGAALGLIVALQMVPLLLFGTYAGVVLDRHDPRIVLLITNSVNAALGAALVAVTATGHINEWSLGGFALAFGFMVPFDRPATQVIPVELVPPPLVSNALGLNSMVQSLARLVGPALAGITFALVGASWCFAVNAVSFIVAVGFLLALDRSKLYARPRSTSGRGQIREGFAYLRRSPQLRSILLANAFIGLLAFNFMVVITAMVQIQFDGGGFAVGIAHAANALGALVGGALAGAVLARLSRHLDLVVIALGAAFASIAVAPTLAVFVLLGPLLGLTFVAYHSSVLDSCRRLARPDMFGRMVSLVTIGMQGTTPIGSVIVGALIDVRSPRVALGLGAASCLLAGGLLTVVGRRRQATRDEALPAIS
jgi:MFS family permease